MKKATDLSPYPFFVIKKQLVTAIEVETNFKCKYLHLKRVEATSAAFLPFLRTDDSGSRPLHSGIEA